MLQIGVGSLGLAARAAAAAWTPLADANLSGWWVGSDVADGAVSAWTSRDPSGRQLTQATSANQPIKSTASGVGVLAFDGSNDTLTQAIGSFSGVFVAGQILPDIPHAIAGKGFTCTGCEAAADDTIWVAYHGQAESTDTDWYTSLVHLSADGATLLEVITLYDKIPGIQSCQDVTIDTLRNLLVFTDVTNKRIYRMTFAGVISDYIQLTDYPNGISYDAARDGYWYNRSPSLEVTNPTLVDCIAGSSTGSTVTVLVTQGVSLSDRDSLSYDNTSRTLAMSAGANGSDGTVQLYNTSSGTISLIGRIACPGFNAPEGITLRGGKLRGFNDAYYHRDSSPSPTPNLNRMLTWTIVPAASRVMCIFGLFQETAATTGTDAVMSCGDPVTAGSSNTGFSIFSASNTQVSIFAQTGGSSSTTQDTLPNTTVASFTNPAIIVAVIDEANDLITLYYTQAGTTQVATATASKITGGFSSLNTLRIASSASSDGSGRYWKGNVWELGLISGPPDVSRLQGWVAWNNGRVSDLPSNHPYKSAAPRV